MHDPALDNNYNNEEEVGAEKKKRHWLPSIAVKLSGATSQWREGGGWGFILCPQESSSPPSQPNNHNVTISLL